jgi:2'-5' RNA ligase
MMEVQLNLFEEETHEYFFLIQPDLKTEREVKFYKRIVNGSIPLSKENLWSIPHLSLFKRTVNYSMDDHIIRQTTKALEGKRRFMIRLDGLDVYNHGNIKRSLVLKVKNPTPIRSINRSLREVFKFRVPEISPHITIVRSIPLNEFNKIVRSLDQFNYRGEFFCNKITILKKVAGLDKNYKVLYEADLN